MPGVVLLAAVTLGVTGLGLLLTAIGALIASGSLLVATGGLLGTAELIALGRLVERRPAARVVTIGLALVQTLGGVIALAGGQPAGLILVVLAGVVVLPLSTKAAEDYFAEVPQ